ncbi:MAG: immunoglobulin domain-containing protein [Kiritimatiellae bacterium]|nr:immunoglobulin domain-containing protein [Kiritimatiellia bacterium]
MGGYRKTWLSFFRGLLVAAAFSAVAAFGYDANSLLPAWASYVGSVFSDGDEVTAVAAGNGAVYAAGSLGLGVLENDDGIDFSSLGGRDGFVIRTDSDGVLQWAAALGDLYLDRMCGLAVDADECVYAVGRCQTTRADRSATYGFITKLDGTTGEQNWQWSMLGQWGSTNSLNAVCVAADGAVYAVGHASAANLACNVTAATIRGVDYGLQPRGGVDAVAMKFSSSGELLWLRYIGGLGWDSATACAVCADGGLVLGGETYTAGGWTNIGSDTQSALYKSGFITKLTADGEHLWTSYLAGADAVSVSALTADSSSQYGTIYVGGVTASSTFLMINSVRFRNGFAGGTDGFLLRLSENESAFSVDWGRLIGGAGNDSVSAVVIGREGQVAVGGTVSSEVAVSTDDGSAFSGGKDGFAAFFPSNGLAHMWWSYQGGNDSDSTLALDFSSAGLLTGGVTKSKNWVQGGFKDDWEDDDFSTGSEMGYIKVWAPPMPPSFSSDLQDLTVMDGESAVFSMMLSGTQTLSYFWYWNDVFYPDATGNSLTIATVTDNMDGSTFYCVVTNGVGSVTSPVVTLTVTNRPPVVVADVESVTVVELQDARFEFSVDGGSAPLYYTWYRNGEPIADADGSEYSINSVLLQDNGSLFYCVCSNQSGVVISSEVLLTVNQRPLGQLSVNLTPADCGGAWSVDCGHTWNESGATVSLEDGRYNVIFKSVDGYAAPEPIIGVLMSRGVERTESAEYYSTTAVEALRVVSGNTITLYFNPPEGTRRWLGSEMVADGLIVTSLVGSGAEWDPEYREIVLNARGETPVTITYTVSGPDGVYDLAGEVNFGSGYQNIIGAETLTLGGEGVRIIPPPDILSVSRVGDAEWKIRFVSIKDAVYTVQSCESAGVDYWHPVTSVNGVAGETEVVVPGGPIRLFYRVSASGAFADNGGD